MSMNNENAPMSVAISLGSLTADATVAALVLLKKSKIVAAHVIDSAGIAADNTNYVLLDLKEGSTVIASLDSRAAGQGALTALVAKAMVLVAAQQTREAGASLSLAYNEEGTVALTNAQLVVSYFPL